MVILQAVDGQGDQFDAAFTELTAQSGNSTQLCSAHRGVVSGVGEQDPPPGIERDKRYTVTISILRYLILSLSHSLRLVRLLKCNLRFQSDSSFLCRTAPDVVVTIVAGDESVSDSKLTGCDLVFTQTFQT